LEAIGAGSDDIENRYPNLFSERGSVYFEMSERILSNPRLAREILARSTDFSLKNSVEKAIQRNILSRSDEQGSSEFGWYKDWAIEKYSLDPSNYKNFVRSFNRSEAASEIPDGAAAVQALLIEEDPRFRDSFEREMAYYRRKAEAMFETERAYESRVERDRIRTSAQMETTSPGGDDLLPVEEFWIEMARMNLSLRLEEGSRHSSRLALELDRLLIDTPANAHLNEALLIFSGEFEDQLRLESLREEFRLDENSSRLSRRQQSLGHFARIFQRPEEEFPVDRVVQTALLLRSIHEIGVSVKSAFVEREYAIRTGEQIQYIRSYRSKDSLTEEEEIRILELLFQALEEEKLLQLLLAGIY
jgi:hypothetical protein